MMIMLSKCISTGVHFHLSSYFASDKMTTKVSPLYPSDIDTFDAVRFIQIETRRLSIEFIAMLMRTKLQFLRFIGIFYIFAATATCVDRA